MKTFVLFTLLFVATFAGVVKRQTNDIQFPQQFPNFGQTFPFGTQFGGQVVTQAPAVAQTAGTTTTLSPNTLDCIRLCPRTVEYNAVCGTNNVTYDNRSHLRCAQSCGIVVDFRRLGTCRT